MPRPAPALCALALLGLALTGARGEEPPASAFEFKDYLVAPVCVHLWQSKADPNLHTTLTEADIARIFAKVNRVWQPAGLGFTIESIVHDAPEPDEAPELDLPGPLPWLPQHIAAGTHRDDLFSVFYLKRFHVNGIYYPKAIFVQDTARLRPVEGGIDEPLPRVTAHELGHALGLPHRQDTFNLMASGTTGTLLNTAEIATVRENALAPWRFVRATELLDRAVALERDAHLAEALAIYRSLAALPLTGEPLDSLRARLKTATPAP